MNKHCDLSISVDSAGTSVMSHGLYFKENVVVGQPQQFKCLNVINILECLNACLFIHL